MDNKQEEQLAFINTLKALDDAKMEQAYLSALRDIAETVFDMEFDNNNQVIVEPNAEH